ncbi:unnamed protein product [Peronospora farinosa]|uniref:Uncharacterized protein n=1 Tax=Peronospora farinosa TaxID=134698 RepID=A0ABN8BXK8_9STRA|nr:unnamed protein product [Peronospora farinosa]
MGNVVFAMLYSRQENLLCKVTASDLLLDQMEKQTFIATTPSYLELITRYCTIVLSSLAMLLMGPLGQPKKAPVYVDAVCQTENETWVELTTNYGVQPCHVNSKCDIDDDCHFCTTEVTDLFIDIEADTGIDSDEFENDLNDEWEDVNSSADNLSQSISDANNMHCNTCNCETHAEQLLHLNWIKSTKSKETPSSIYVEEYLCSCGECPQYKEIAHDVAVKVKELQCNFLQKQNIIRLLQAFSTYNEVIGYRIDMIPTACDCLRFCCGDEDKAFESFVTLYDELPRLCDITCGD